MEGWIPLTIVQLVLVLSDLLPSDTVFKISSASASEIFSSDPWIMNEIVYAKSNVQNVATITKKGIYYITRLNDIMKKGISINHHF